jgi:hypothetical protein
VNVLPTNQTLPGPAAAAASGPASVWPAGVSCAVEGTGTEVQVVPLKLSRVVLLPTHTSVGDKAVTAEPVTAAPVWVVAFSRVQVLPFQCRIAPTVVTAYASVRRDGQHVGEAARR